MLWIKKARRLKQMVRAYRAQGRVMGNQLTEIWSFTIVNQIVNNGLTTH